jgi:hypothetical protein
MSVHRQWKGKALTAREWKRNEHAWLDQLQVAQKVAGEARAANRVWDAEKQERIRQQRNERLTAWKEKYKDDDLTLLLFGMYEIASSIEGETEDVSPLNEHEMEMMRACRAYLKSKDMPNRGGVDMIIWKRLIHWINRLSKQGRDRDDFEREGEFGYRMDRRGFVYKDGRADEAVPTWMRRK